MVYSAAGSFNLLLILGCLTSNFGYLSFSTLHFSSFWCADTTTKSYDTNLPTSKYVPPPPTPLHFLKMWTFLDKEKKLLLLSLVWFVLEHSRNQEYCQNTLMSTSVNCDISSQDRNINSTRKRYRDTVNTRI